MKERDEGERDRESEMGRKGKGNERNTQRETYKKSHKTFFG